MDGGHRWTLKMGRVGLRSAVRQGWLAAAAAEFREQKWVTQSMWYTQARPQA